MSRIKQTFAALRRRNEAALVPFIMAGDPDLDVTRALLLEAAEAGADLIELGVPFSDPTADGPVIQRAGLRALAHRTSLRQILELVAELRRGGFTTPIILFGYYNPIFHYGPPRLVVDPEARFVIVPVLSRGNHVTGAPDPAGQTAGSGPGDPEQHAIRPRH